MTAGTGAPVAAEVAPGPGERFDRVVLPRLARTDRPLAARAALMRYGRAARRAISAARPSNWRCTWRRTSSGPTSGGTLNSGSMRAS